MVLKEIEIKIDRSYIAAVLFTAFLHLPAIRFSFFFYKSLSLVKIQNG